MRYIPHTDADREAMLAAIGVTSIDDLFHEIPDHLRVKGMLGVPASLDEYGLVKELGRIGERNRSLDKVINFLGAGIYEHYVPSLVMPLVTRGEFLTAYTPYQPEASQGYLQTIYEFQSMICAITGMDVANASMYDGATALASAALMAHATTGRHKVLVSKSVHPHYRDCVRTFAVPLSCDVIEFDGNPSRLCDDETACVIVQYPDFYGRVHRLDDVVAASHSVGALAVVCAEPIALGVLKPPGDYGVDVVVGEAQPLGIPMGYGGPVAGYFAVKKEYIRSIPGRIVGKSFDKNGRRGFVMTLRTREQDIRRERATSNICTNQALMALVATVWMTALGKDGYRKLSETCVQNAHYAQRELCRIPGVSLKFPDSRFGFEFVIDVGRDATEVQASLLDRGFLAGLPLGEFDHELASCLLVAVTEVRTKSEIDDFVAAVARVVN